MVWKERNAITAVNLLFFLSFSLGVIYFLLIYQQRVEHFKDLRCSTVQLFVMVTVKKILQDFQLLTILIFNILDNYSL